MSGCRVDTECSQQLQKLVAHWKKKGYPSVSSDLQEALQEISKDSQACRARKVGRFSEVLGDLSLYKYRQKNSQRKEGAQGGWRIYGIFDDHTLTLYPIIIYPKKDWDEADDDTIKAAIKEIVDAINK